MSEEFVKRKIEKWLKENDFPKPQVHKKEKHGVDIKAKHATQGIYYLIEAKGEGKSPSVDEGNLKNALGQIVTRYEVKSYKYAIGLPEDSAKKLKKKVPYLAAKALNLRILSVGPKGNVEEFPPKSFKKPTNS